jgi:hypothetical protein
MTARLSRFRPNAAGLDRDAILFAAGRRSARGSWAWKWLSVLLIASQVMTFVVLWPKKPKPENPVAPLPTAAPASEPIVPPLSLPADMWTAGSPPDVLQSAPVLAAAQFVPPEPPLTVRSAIPDF